MVRINKGVSVPHHSSKNLLKCVQRRLLTNVHYFQDQYTFPTIESKLTTITSLVHPSSGSCWFRDRAWPGAPCPPSTACSRHQSSSAPAPPRSSPGGACWRCRRSRLRYDRIEKKGKTLGREKEREIKRWFLIS